MQGPLILVIDDSPTIRKMVECHLSQAGYRVELAPSAELGLEMAGRIRPDLILLDHQLPGTTGEEVCRLLLECETTARVPVVISSALRHRAFARYAEFSNVIDQIPKPFTPELLKSGVSNALQMGALVVQAQRTGCAMPEAVGEERSAGIEGDSTVVPFRALIDFLNNLQISGRITLEQGKDRIRFAIAAGRIQGVYSPTITADRFAAYVPDELADLEPLLAVTLGEHQDASMSGLVKLLERSLSDPRRLRGLLRFQSSVLTFWALAGDPGHFVFETDGALPPMFQAFPLQLSLPALAIEGVRRCVSPGELQRLGSLHFLRQTPRGGNVDRSGLNPTEVRVHTLLDGNEPVAAVAARVGLDMIDVATVARGLELAGQAERRNPTRGASMLLLEDDPEAARLVVRALGPEGDGYEIRHVRDRVAAQLLLRRTPFGIVMLPIDNTEQEAFYHSLRSHAPASTRFIGMLRIDEESQLDRLDALGLDGVLHRPLSENDLRATVQQLLATACSTAS
ncbi:MAG: response regulator [Isosphaeraceae bacterium]